MATNRVREVGRRGFRRGDNRLGLVMSDAVELAQIPEVFERWLAGRPLAERSRREYARNVRAYCAWLAETPDRDGWQGDPLTDRLARDHAARDFRRWLQVERRGAPSTVNLALASLDALYRCLELGRPNVRRDKPAQAAPRALDEAGQRLLLRALRVGDRLGERVREGAERLAGVALMTLGIVLLAEKLLA